MGAYLLTVSASLLCPHGGPIQGSPGSARVKSGNQAVALKNDNFQVSACMFIVPPTQPHPCVKVQWLHASHPRQGRRRRGPATKQHGAVYRR